MITGDNVNTKLLRVNRRRLEQSIQELAVFGRGDAGEGITRPFGSKPDMQARRWLQEYWGKELELPVTTDAIANMWVRLPGAMELPAIALGSHHDTVTNGGAYDGAAGVLLATEVLKRIKEEGIQLRHPLMLVSFSGEEPNAFNVSTLGSKVCTGKLGTKAMYDKADNTGTLLFRDVLRGLGGNPEALEGAVISQGDISAFLECHNEQGRKLEDRALRLGAATQIIGIYREKVRVIGEANHTGTTLMRDRHDALPAAAEIILAAERAICGCKSDEVVGTVGYLTVSPNSTNIIPCMVEMILEIRAIDPAYKERILSELEPQLEAIGGRRGVRIERDVILNQPAKIMNPQLTDALCASMEALGEEHIRLISMAGHDAANISDVTRSGLLFIRSVNGKSHCPDELCRPEDVARAGDVLLQTVLMLDKELDAQ